MKIIRLLLLFILSAIVFGGCSRWNVETMASKKIISIPRGTKPGQVELPVDKKGITNLTLTMSVSHDVILLADNITKRVQVLSMDGTPKMVIGNTKNIGKKKYPVVSFDFSVIGQLALDSENVLYIQNRVQPHMSGNGNGTSKGNYSSDFSPSFILVFNEGGELIHTLGKNGTPDQPFFYIEHLIPDSQGRLFVITRSFNTWSVFRFHSTARDFALNLNTLDLVDKKEKDTFKVKIENVSVSRSGDILYLSVAYYSDLRFKYRRIYQYIIPEKRLEPAMMELRDPKNVFFSLYDDKSIYFWDMTGKEIRFMITDFTGKRTNTTSIARTGTNIHYSRIFPDDNGSIFSYTISDKEISLFSWK